MLARAIIMPWALKVGLGWTVLGTTFKLGFRCVVELVSKREGGAKVLVFGTGCSCIRGGLSFSVSIGYIGACSSTLIARSTPVVPVTVLW